MEILTIDKPVAANPYTEDVAELIAATDANTEPGKVVAGGIKVAADAVNKERVKFAQAANAAGKTASLVHKLDELTPDADGNVTILFTLTKKHAARRGVKPATDAPAEAPVEPVVEAPAESVAEDVKPEGKPRGPRR